MSFRLDRGPKGLKAQDVMRLEAEVGAEGLFFDDYCHESFEKSFGLMQSIGNSYLKAYLPITKTATC